MEDLKKYLSENAPENKNMPTDRDELKEELELIVRDFVDIVQVRFRELFYSIKHPSHGVYSRITMPYYLKLSKKYEYPIEETKPGYLLDVIEQLVKAEKSYMTSKDDKTNGCDFLSYYWALITLVEDFGEDEYKN